MRIISLICVLLLSTFSAQSIAADSAKSADTKKEEAKPTKEESEAADNIKKPKIYLKLDPALVLNVEEKDVTRFLQVNAQLQFTDPLAQAIIEKHMPAIRHSIIMTISGSDVPKIKTSQGKEDLRKATLADLQKLMTEITEEPVIEEVYFTGFIIQ